MTINQNRHICESCGENLDIIKSASGFYEYVCGNENCENYYWKVKDNDKK